MNKSTRNPSAAVGIADMILYNGKVVTADRNFNVVEAVAICDGKFLAVGGSAEILVLAGPNTKKIDVKGKTVIPGIMDTHQHPEEAGELKFVVNFEKARTVADALAVIKEFASKVKPGEWIRGSGWYALSQLEEKRWLTRYEIDRVAPDNPVYLTQTGHDAMCNSYALRSAKITKDTSDPAGGIIERDPETGEPNGVLHEAAQYLVRDLVPPWTLDIQVKILKEAMKYCNSFGITSNVPGYISTDAFKIYQNIWAKREMTVRVSGNYFPVGVQMPPPDEWEQIVSGIGVYPDVGDEWLSFSALKWFVDGGFRIAWTREPHSDPLIGHGISLIPSEYLNKVVVIANRYNWRVAIHCVGDAAIDEVLDAYDYANREKSIVGRRWVLIHACLMQPDQMERAKKLGVIVTLQDFMWIRAASVEKDLGKNMADRVSPARSIIDKLGIENVSLGTDYSVNPMNPFICMYVFITRKDPRGVAYGADQAIAREEALRLYTSSAAYYTFSEHVKGSIEPGKLADLAVISDDLLTCPAEAIKDIKAMMTIVDGKIVYEAK
jgi:predicted amidohydrolase YtcJ